MAIHRNIRQLLDAIDEAGENYGLAREIIKRQ